MIYQNPTPNIQIQPQVVSDYDLSCPKFTCVNVGINTLKVHKYDPSNIDLHTSCLQNHTDFVTSLSYDVEPDITMHTYQKIITLNNIYHDLSAGINTDQENVQIFLKNVLSTVLAMIMKKLTRDKNWAVTHGYVCQ